MNIVLQFLGTLWLNVYFIKSSLLHCSNRYEFQEEIKEALPHLKNCSVVRKLFPICNQQITVLYSQHPPYVFSINKTSEPIGLLPDILRLIMDVCCHGCVDIIFRGPVNPLQKFLYSNATIYMPLESAYNSKIFFGIDYIPFMKVSAVSILAKEMCNKATEYTRHLMTSVLNTWPLFSSAILMAMISGCVMWLLDTWFNSDEFPQRFPRGVFEGFWWAFVSMATVGYGDRAPKSFVARIFAVIWILLGVTIFSMYTAVLTAALQTKSNHFHDENFVNKTVGVLSFTGAGKAVVFEEHGRGIQFKSVEEMALALKDDSLHAIALDDNIAMYYMHQLQERIQDLKRHHRVQGLQNSYGILSYNDNITNMIRPFFETNGDQQHALVSHVMDMHWQSITAVEENIIDSTTYFSSDSPVFYATIVGLLILGMVAIVTGLLCKYIDRNYGDVLTKIMNCTKEKFLRCEKVKPTKIEYKHHSISDFFIELEDFNCRWKDKFVR